MLTGRPNLFPDNKESLHEQVQVPYNNVNILYQTTPRSKPSKPILQHSALLKRKKVQDRTALLCIDFDYKKVTTNETDQYFCSFSHYLTGLQTIQ